MAAAMDSYKLESTPETVGHTTNDWCERHKGSNVNAAVDALGHLLALRDTPANEQDRARFDEPAQALWELIGEWVARACRITAHERRVSRRSAQHGIRLEFVTLADTKFRECVAFPARRARRH
jgi:hypothetical protein